MKEILKYNSEEREKILLFNLKNKNYDSDLFFTILNNMDNNSLNYIKDYLFLYLGNREYNNFLLEIIKRKREQFSIYDIFNKYIDLNYIEDIIDILFSAELNKINTENINKEYKQLIEKKQVKTKLENF